MQDGLSALEALGLSWPSPAYVFGVIVFGLIGTAAFYSGRKTKHRGRTWLGVALMAYPYAVSQTWLLYAVGAALCAALWLDRF